MGNVADHSIYGRSTIMWSLAAALDEFLGSPSAGCVDRGRWARNRRGASNEDLIIEVCGTLGVKARDKALYDPCRRDDRTVETFEQAFRVVAVPYDQHGHRDWRDFEIATLRECHDLWRNLRLPEWVEESFMAKEIDAWVAAHAEEGR